ncbi:MAG TPA: DUF6635 family protein [Acetobacteraceae bacterium]|nr:DUF6635 family protein [Acetobacteraceae bacterium]
MTTTAIDKQRGNPPSDAEIRDIVHDGVKAYFRTRHARVGPFVDRHFSLRGTMRLHRAALGWDIARAPFNLGMAAPQVGLFLAASAARRLGARRLARTIEGKRLVVPTEVARALAWLIHTELLELPFQDGNRVATHDALAETILADPRLADAMQPELAAIGQKAADPSVRRRLEDAMAEYALTRTAASEVTTALFSLGTGALALRKVTPGAMSLAPVLASAMARHAAISAFPLGSALGSVWYALFPVAPAAALVAGLTGGMMMAATLAAAFAGVIADPVQRRLGLHQWRLHRMLDALERQMLDPSKPGYKVHDHYVARLLDLFDVVGTVYRLSMR